MVQTNKLLSPQEYIEKVTGRTYVISGYNDIQFIENALKFNNLSNLRHFKFEDISVIAQNNYNVVLVDCLVENETTNQMDHVLTWFEVNRLFNQLNDEGFAELSALERLRKIISIEYDAFKLAEQSKTAEELFRDWYEIGFKDTLKEFFNCSSYEDSLSVKEICEWILENTTSPLEFVYCRFMDIDASFDTSFDSVYDILCLIHET